MQEIVKKYLEGSATESEKTRLLNWLRKKENRIVYSRLKLDWKRSLHENQFFNGGEESWNRLQARLWQKSYNRWQESRKINQFFRYAAIFFFALTVGSIIWFFTSRPTQLSETFTSVVADKGQISKVELPDGSTVWLNSGSEITYSNFFATQNRNIQLFGEAFFDVIKNDELPLQVLCNKLHVKVLGTKFNVAAYNWDESVEVVLEDGSVELLHPVSQSTIYKMNPGEKALLSAGSAGLKVSEVNTSRYTAWKEGMIHIYDQSMEELVKRLEMRYNQKFEISAGAKDFKYTFTIKNERLDEIIQLMEKITPVKAVQKDSVILIETDEEKMRKVER